jgi:hypothetical protein
MFKELLSKPQENNIEEENVRLNQTKEMPLKFNEILCPETYKPVTLSKCSSCVHKQEFQRKNDLGPTLTAIVCNWSE